MNHNSKICCFINENPTSWRKLLNDELNINVKEEPPFAIFNYAPDCDFSNPIVQEARGIIIDLSNLEVVCWPFRKFMNYENDCADKIDWKTAHIQEKIDGSIIKLWWNKYKEKWQFSTNSMIDADDAIANSLKNRTFMDLIVESAEYPYIMRMADKSAHFYTHIFELVSPDSQVVVKYPKTQMWYIGKRNNLSGLESDPCFPGIPSPQKYSFGSLDECIAAASSLNTPIEEKGYSIEVEHEGFVVVDASWNRIKVKSPEYYVMHRMSCNKNFSKRRILKLLRDHSVDIADMVRAFPDFAVYFKYYDFRVTELNHLANLFCGMTDRIYEEFDHDRKAVASVISKHRFGAIGFRHLDTGKSGKEILKELNFGTYCKYIPEYQPENLIDTFAIERDKR